MLWSVLFAAAVAASAVSCEARLDGGGGPCANSIFGGSLANWTMPNEASTAVAPAATVDLSSVPGYDESRVLSCSPFAPANDALINLSESFLRGVEVTWQQTCDFIKSNSLTASYDNHATRNTLVETICLRSTARLTLKLTNGTNYSFEDSNQVLWSGSAVDGYTWGIFNTSFQADVLMMDVSHVTAELAVRLKEDCACTQVIASANDLKVKFYYEPISTSQTPVPTTAEASDSGSRRTTNAATFMISAAYTSGGDKSAMINQTTSSGSSSSASSIASMLPTSSTITWTQSTTNAAPSNSSGSSAHASTFVSSLFASSSSSSGPLDGTPAAEVSEVSAAGSGFSALPVVVVAIIAAIFVLLAFVAMAFVVHRRRRHQARSAVLPQANMPGADINDKKEKLTVSGEAIGGESAINLSNATGNQIPIYNTFSEDLVAETGSASAHATHYNTVQDGRPTANYNTIPDGGSAAIYNTFPGGNPAAIYNTFPGGSPSGNYNTLPDGNRGGVDGASAIYNTIPDG